MKAHEEDIPLRFRKDLVKAVERLSRFRDAERKLAADAATVTVSHGSKRSP
jgi:hypothetical protein